MSEGSKQIFQRYFDEAANGGNLDLLDEIFAADYLHHDPANPDPAVGGAEGVEDHLASLMGAFPDLKFEVDDMVAKGEEIVVRWTARAPTPATTSGCPPTGKPIEITGMNTWNTRDGKAIEGWVNRDDMLLLQQLGVIPSPG